MYHQINLSETFRERQLALLGEAEKRRLARRLRSGRGRNTRSARVLATLPLGFLAVLVVVAGIVLVGSSSPAQAETTFTVNTTADLHDLISGNEISGGVVEDGSNSGLADSTNDRVEGNLIGPERDGTSTMGNGAEGVAVLGDTATGARILSNSIFSNGGLGIDLQHNGSTPNDPGDTDVGPNGLQNFPLLSSAKTSRRGTTVKGTLNSRPGASYTIQYFSNPPGTDEGARFIGQRSVSVDGSGNASFSFKPKKKVGAGQNITATATNDFTGDTSEFSAPKKVVR
jgi:hypothetical protein